MSLLETLTGIINDLPKSLKIKKEQGSKVVGYFCGFIPEELITAAGLIPLRLVSGSNPEAMRTGEEYIKSYSCPYVRTCIGNNVNVHPYHELLDAICIACTCDGMKNLKDYWKRYFNTPVYIVDIPKTSNRFRTRKHAEKYFTTELKQLKQNLEDLSGNKITDKKLIESIRFHNLIRSRIRSLYEYLNIDPSPISWSEILKISHIGFLIDRVQFLNEVSRILGGLTYKPETQKKIARARYGRPRLTLYGSVMTLEDTKVIDIVEKAGGQIVGDALCTGSRFWRKDVALDRPLMDALVDRYLYNIPCAHMTDIMMRLNYAIATARESEADGLIYYSLKACDTFRSEIRIFEKAIQKELGIPTLMIETEYSPADIGTTRTKIEAFIEMLRGI